jgi:hypothetical protein
MHLNAYCAYGSIIVRILSSGGEPKVILESISASKNSLDLTVEWPGNGLAKLDRNRPVRIQFELRNAKLYSYWAD